jgi:hypothetical protein
VVDQIKAIQTAQTGRQHYNYCSATEHPSCVNLNSGLTANTWVHQNILADDITFGFQFSKQNGG